MQLTKENLNLYRVTSIEDARYALTGVHVDPRAKVTAASNGAVLVEVTAPAGKSGGDGSKPFILPAKVAQQLVKELADGGKAHVGNDNGKPVLALANGKTKIAFDPIDGTFPDYSKGDHFTGKDTPLTLTCDWEYLQDVLKAASVGKTIQVTLHPDRIRFESEPRDVNMAVGKTTEDIDGKKLNFDAEYLRQVLIATAIGEQVTLSMYNDRLRIESRKDDGQAARGVIMCCSQPAPARAERATKPNAEPVAPKVEKPEATPKPKPAVVEDAPAPAPARFRRWGRYRRGKPFVPKECDANKPPSERQRMLYTYFLRRREEEITPEILESTDFVGKLDELKEGLSFDPNFASWNQWLKVNYLLLDQKADPETVCEVLNGITYKKSASEAISFLSKTPAPAAA